MTEGTGVLFDGAAASPRTVAVGLVAAALTLAEPGTDWHADWPLHELRIVDRTPDGLRLRRLGHEARLLLPPGALAEVAQQRVWAVRPRRHGRIALVALASLAAMLLVWRGGTLATDFLAGLVPASVAASISDVAMAQLAGGQRGCDDLEGTAALVALGDRLALAAELESGPRLQVIDRPGVNAFVLPDGRVVVLRGLLARADSAEAVAGVLAHEFGHVRHNHAMRNFVRAAGIAALGSLMTGGSDLGAIGAGLVSLSHTRRFEREADADALRTLEAAGIDPDGLRRFLRSLAAEGGEGTAWLSSHPAPDERLNAMPAASAAPSWSPALSPVQWAALRRICG